MANSRDYEFTVRIFESDLEAIQNWVLQYPNKETGGDLFGLGLDRDHAVIHVVLGPGENCKHGEYSFYQDVDYLEKVGKTLTSNFMLGHIGEWHSHHRLKLDKPSEGDCMTIARNFPQDSHGFILMIANIITEKDVSVSPYIFYRHDLPYTSTVSYEPGHVEIVGRQRSPFRLLSEISSQIENGEEKPKEHKQKYGCFPLNYFK